MKIFAEMELDDFLGGKSSALSAEIESQPQDYILNVNESGFLDYIVSKYTVDIIAFKFADVFVSSSEQEIAAEQFPGLFNVHPGHKYKRPVVKYHIPFEGDADLLECLPTSRILWTTNVTIEQNCVCFEIVSFYDNPDLIKGSADDVMHKIDRQCENVRAQLEVYNARLRADAQQIFQARKQRILKTSDVLSNLGVPIKKKDELPSTFAIPTPRVARRIGVSKPNVLHPGTKPEPSLDKSTYEDILQIIHDVGRQYERMPSTYSGKHEEDLRDHFLLFLEPRFEGSATGETFNKSGKTDILLRHQGTNVFIAECKFWKGPKVYLDTITQLLGYLTWRDSKAAVILFVQNKDFSSVIAQIESTTPSHLQYVALVNKKEHTWFNYRFHLPDDPGRELSLAVILFHFP